MSFVEKLVEKIVPTILAALYLFFSACSLHTIGDVKNLTEERKAEVNYRVCVQMGKMNYNLRQLGYYKPALTKEETINLLNKEKKIWD